MTLSRSDYGSYHRITGTLQEVFEGLGFAHIMPEDIVYIKSDGTEAIYQHGLANKVAVTKTVASNATIV